MPSVLITATRKQLVPTLVSHLISHMNYGMAQTNYQHDNPANQEVVTCVGHLLSRLSNYELNRLVVDTHSYTIPSLPPYLPPPLPPSLPPSPSLPPCRSPEDVVRVMPLMHPLLNLCKHLPPTNKLSVSQPSTVHCAHCPLSTVHCGYLVSSSSSSFVTWLTS